MGNQTVASLFGKNRLKDLAAAINSADLMPKIEIARKWHEDLLRGTLRFDNETSREQQYNADFFKTILGYVEKPASPYTFQPKSSTGTGEIPDARVGYFHSVDDIDETVAVVELKGASTSLDSPQRSYANRTPVQQAFGYKSLYRHCSFVIVSNFAELRLYNDNQLDFEVWTLADLINPADDYLQFKTFYILLNANNLPRLNGASVTEGLLSDIRVRQEDIGKKFYADYSEARMKLLESLYRRNERVRADLDFGIEKAQKIIDRTVFAAFAEDRGLLPDNTLQRLTNSAKNSPFSMWSALKGLFEGIDKGSHNLEIPVGYNGGLFARDTDLDDLEIDDSAVSGVVALGGAKFAEDLSVTILGHLFEQSISDLQEIRDQSTNTPGLVSFSASRRRNDGIYYTPEHVVRHIVDRSLGEYLRDAEQRIWANHKLHSRLKDKSYSERERTAYLEYRDFLLNVKVVDPAVGSGAFLVHVLDVLMAENLRIAAVLGNDIFSNAELTAQILRNNIFGVDINEESVEITKLSLWLKTASKGNKLAGLDGNIKCGNSLKPVATRDGDKAFDWNAEFPEIMESGGFDVVVGNPPYIKEYTHRSAFLGLHDNAVYQGKMDLWYMFGDLALSIVKPETGRIAFIAPNNWITNAGASKFRDRVVNDGRILEYYDFGDYMVFEQAAIQTMVYVMARSDDNDKYQFPYNRLTTGRLTSAAFGRFLEGVADPRFERFVASFSKADSLGNNLNINEATIDGLLDIIKASGPLRLQDDEVSTGIDVHQDYLNSKGAAVLGNRIPVGSGIFNLSQTEYDALKLNAAERALVRPFYTTSQLHRYWAEKDHTAWVIYTDSKYKNSAMDGLPNLKAHLDKFEPVITSDNAPYGLHRARAEHFFQGEKILSLRKCARPTFTYTDFDAYVSQTYFVIQTSRWEMRALTALLNSSLVAFWLRYRGKMQGGLFQVDKGPLKTIPLLIPSNGTELTNLATTIIEQIQARGKLSTLFQLIIMQEAPTWTKDNPHWWELSPDEMLESLPMIFALNKREELLEVFERYGKAASDSSRAIADAEERVDEIVFGEYGLDQDQIHLVRTKLATL